MKAGFCRSSAGIKPPETPSSLPLASRPTCCDADIKHRGSVGRETPAEEVGGRGGGESGGGEDTFPSEGLTLNPCDKVGLGCLAAARVREERRCAGSQRKQRAQRREPIKRPINDFSRLISWSQTRGERPSLGNPRRKVSEQRSLSEQRQTLNLSSLIMSMINFMGFIPCFAFFFSPLFFNSEKNLVIGPHSISAEKQVPLPLNSPQSQT